MGDGHRARLNYGIGRDARPPDRAHCQARPFRDLPASINDATTKERVGNNFPTREPERPWWNRFPRPGGASVHSQGRPPLGFVVAGDADDVRVQSVGKVAAEQWGTRSRAEDPDDNAGMRRPGRCYGSRNPSNPRYNAGVNVRHDTPA